MAMILDQRRERTAGSQATAEVASERPRSPHARPARGLVNATSSSTRDSLFGRMFRGLPELVLENQEMQFDVARLIAQVMHSENELEDMTAAEKEAEVLAAGGDEDENPRIPSGYTYFGQFVDHDITFDPASSLDRQNDPDALHNFRTPRLDLDSVYGSGPDDQPYMYNGPRFVLGGAVAGSGDPGAHDLPRLNGRAIIGDKRNDENVIVSQLQSTFLRFHNRIVDEVSAKGSGDVFQEAQRLVRWHYQWVVIHDFLVKVCGRDVVYDILGVDRTGVSTTTYVTQESTNGAAPTAMGFSPNFRFYDPREHSFMPVEFAGALYRFGHSMVRPFYRLNDAAGPFETFNTSNDPAQSLTGFQEMALNPVRGKWALDWARFFDMKPLQGRKNAGELTDKRVQPSYKIDTRIVFPLSNLPKREFGESPPRSSLAMRNILRGFTLGLPSGQAVANLMGLEPLGADDILLGDDATPLSTVVPQIGDQTPLWVYVLAEAQANMETDDDDFHNTGRGTLGPVAARLVAEVLIGLIARDRFSYLAQEPRWHPVARWCDAKSNFGLPQLIRVAQSGDMP